MTEASLASYGVELRDDTVRIPYRAADGHVHRYRVFAASGRTWWEGLRDERDRMPLIPYGLETLPKHARHLFDLAWCEGESDTLALRQAIPEIVALGVPGATAFRPDWRGWCLGFRTVYVLGDGDAPGRRFNQAVSAVFPAARHVPIPDGEDVRSVVQAGRALPFGAADRLDMLYRTFMAAPTLDILRRTLQPSTST